jgi:hypothetical protein
MTMRLVTFLAAFLALSISFTASPDALYADGKSVEYWEGPGAGVASFRFSLNGYTNTYRLDCASQQFLWVENRKNSSGRVTDNSRGAEWKRINPRSKIASAVYGAVCPRVLSASTPSSPAASTRSGRNSSISTSGPEAADNIDGWRKYWGQTTINSPGKQIA